MAKVVEEEKRISGSSSVLKGTAIIGAAGIIVKILGAIFRIPLTNWIGSIGMSYYQVAYNIYNALVIMAIAGFPVAVSKLVSENVAKKRYGNAHKVFKTAATLMAVIGGVSAGICFFGADILTARIGNPDAALAVRSIAPALLFVPLVSSFRGFFQGRQNMSPTAISEVIEQFFRVMVGFILARVFLSVGLPQTAAGASFGATIGSICALAFMGLVYVMHKQIIRREISRGEDYYEDTKTLVKKILGIAIPIIIGAEVIPIMYAIDMSIIMNRLQATGWSMDESQHLYGLMSGYCNSLINLPEFLIQAIAISMVPAISHAAAKKDKENVESSVAAGYKLTTLIAFPCMVGLMVLAKPIFMLLYPSKIDEAMEAIPTFLLMAISIVTVAMYETSTGALQAVGKQVIPMRNVGVSAVIKVILTYILVGIRSINLNGAAISSIVAFFLAFILNEVAVKKYTGVHIKLKDTYLKPGIASLVMGVCAYGVYRLLALVLGARIAVLIAVLAGAGVYAVLVVALRIAEPEDIAAVPYGHKLNKLINKFVKWE